MDENRFDRLSRSLTTTTPRRALLGLLLGAGSGLVAGRAGAATCRLGGVACGSNGQCCSGRCLGNRTCACSKSVSCKQPANPCKRATCDVATRRCVTRNRTGTCNDTGVCRAGTCCQPEKRAITCAAGCGEQINNCGQSITCRCATEPVAPVEPVGACGEGGPCITFASSGTYTGNLGGLVGADAICNQLAGEAGLQGTYMAWLSDRSVGGSPAQRFATRSSGPYQLVNGTRVVANWNDLVDGTLAHAIDLDENGNPADSDPDEAVWTATTSAGGHSGWGNPLDDCDGWTIGTSDGEGMIGLYFQTDGRWTNVGGVQTCEKRNLIYCFQQS